MSKYIKLEDVQKILSEMVLEANKNYSNRHHIDINGMNFDSCESNILSLAKLKINSLPSISFEEMIKEKLKMCKAQASDSERHFGGMVVCEQLLNKLPK